MLVTTMDQEEPQPMCPLREEIGTYVWWELIDINIIITKTNAILNLTLETTLWLSTFLNVCNGMNMQLLIGPQ